MRKPSAGNSRRLINSTVRMCARIALTEIAQEAWKAHLHEGSAALDATAGNGRDTLFLAQHVGPEGTVYSIDIQDCALKATSRLLESKGLHARVKMRQGDHSCMDKVFPHLQDGCLDLVCFNLGYLPNGDHTITTDAETTVKALAKGLEKTSPRGALSVISYRGHPGALDEHEAVSGFISELPGNWRCVRHEETGSDNRPGPVWWLVCQSA